MMNDIALVKVGCGQRRGSVDRRLYARRWGLVLAVLALLAIACPGKRAIAAVPSGCPSEAQPRDAETIKALERQWLAAEYEGNARFLDCLLAEDYRVIKVRKGTVGSRAELLAAVARKAPSAIKPPLLQTIAAQSDTYATAYSSIRDAKGKIVASFVDFYEYRRGRWVALSGVDL